MNGCTMRPRRGAKVYEYRKYICGTGNVKPGACKRYAIHEDKLLKVLKRMILDNYLAPARLEKLRGRLRARAGARHRGNPAALDGLKKRLVAVEEEIVLARRNVLRAVDDASFAELNAELQVWMKKRDRLNREMATAQKAQAVPLDQTEALVEKAVDRLYELRQELETATPKKVGEILRQLVSRVDLFFEPGTFKGKPCYRFLKGAINLRPMVEIQSFVVDAK
jgi:hypothetical protein